jgi:hypothetical protein
MNQNCHTNGNQMNAKISHWMKGFRPKIKFYDCLQKTINTNSFNDRFNL